MRLDKYKDIWMLKKDLFIISSSLVEFYQEVHWKLDASEDKRLFIDCFKENFNFLLIELDYVMQELWELEINFKKSSIKEICMFLCSEMTPPNKSLIIYTALNECSKNYEDYEISIRTGIYKEELDAVLKEFKEKVMDKLDSKTE